MNKPIELENLTTGDLRGLLAGGKTIKTTALIAIAKYAMASEIAFREIEVQSIKANEPIPTTVIETLPFLVQEIDDTQEAWTKETADLEKRIIEARELSKIGDEITL